MTILGINDGVYAGAAIIRDGRMVSAISEERLIRKKMAIGFPVESIAEVMRLSATKASDIRAVAVATHDEHFRMPAADWIGWFETSASPLKAAQLRLASKAAGLFGRSRIFHRLYYWSRLPASWRRKRAVRRTLRTRWGLMCPVVFVDHHTAHAASAYYTSGFKNATVISIDGGGDGKSAKVFEARNRRLKELFSISSYDSMGNVYAYITQICGFKAHRHEGKITGLAAHGKPIYKPTLERFIEFRDGGFANKSRSYYVSSVEKIRQALPRDFRKEDLACSVQAHLEDLAVQFVRHWVRRTGCGNLAIAGGVAANVRMNQRINEIAEVNDFYVFPAMGDDGLAVGAAYHLWAERYPEAVERTSPYQPMNMYLGTGFSNAEIEAALKSSGVAYRRVRDIEKHVAKLLADGAVVARFTGQMEFGPRALGHRSILYQTTDSTVNDWLNKRLSRTEFMPFAPITLAEYTDQCYLGINGAARAARFMTVTFSCTDWMKKNCPAVVHIDGTARPQLVDRKHEPDLHRLIDEYRKLTGLPSLINTSFNMHEEPIVWSPRDAIRAFQLGRIDYLAIGSFIVAQPVARNGNGNGAHRAERTRKAPAVEAELAHPV